MYYVLDDDHQPVPTDLMGWAEWQRDFSRPVVEKTKVGTCEVSTVFLGIDHGLSFGVYGRPHPAPILFETMIFSSDDSHDGDMWRYTTWDEAVKGHADAVASLSPATTGLGGASATWLPTVEAHCAICGQPSGDLQVCDSCTIAEEARMKRTDDI